MRVRHGLDEKHARNGENVMKKKVAAVVLSVLLGASMLTGCGSQDNSAQSGETTVSDADSANEDAEQEAETTVTDEQEQTEPSVAEEEAKDAEKEETGGVTVRIGSLKGPTSMGLVYLMDQAKKGDTDNNYEFTMAAAADEILPSMISGDLDIALVPANVASVLYNKTQGGVSVIDINTLGVLYMLSGDTSVTSMADLKGRTVYLTGKGTTPDYIMQYLLEQNGLSTDDVKLEYKSEATEVAAVLVEEQDAIGVLPQPFVTAACAQNENLAVVMDLTQEWDAVQGEGGSRLVTGVTIVRNDFLDEYSDAVESFRKDHKESADYANENVEAAAELVAAEGIIEKAPVAAKAMPKCNITYIDGDEMKTALSGYLQVLFAQDPTSVGGAVPGDDFYK